MESSLTTVQAAAVDKPLAVPVKDADGSFGGIFAPVRFAAAEGDLIATGWLEDTSADHAVLVTLPVVEIGGACPVLTLALGPADVPVAGTPIRLAPAELTIRGGPGLLGNLVCAVTHLRDSGSGLALVPDLLNQILARL